MAFSEWDHTWSRMRLGPPSDSCTGKFNFFFPSTMWKQEASNLPPGAHSSIIINLCLFFTSKGWKHVKIHTKLPRIYIKFYLHLLLCSDLFITLLTYSMVQSPSWEANWFAASQEIPCILWNLKVHYHIYKSLPPVPILSQINPVHAPPPPIPLPEDAS